MWVWSVILSLLLDADVESVVFCGFYSQTDACVIILCMNTTHPTHTHTHTASAVLGQFTSHALIITVLFEIRSWFCKEEFLDAYIGPVFIILVSVEKQTCEILQWRFLFCINCRWTRRWMQTSSCWNTFLLESLKKIYNARRTRSDVFTVHINRALEPLRQKSTGVYRSLWQSGGKHVDMICPETRLFIWDSIRRHSILVSQRAAIMNRIALYLTTQTRERSETLICVLMFHAILQFSCKNKYTAADLKHAEKTHHIDAETRGTDASAQLTKSALQKNPAPPSVHPSCVPV